MCVYTHTHTYLCMCVCVYTHTHTHTHTHTRTHTHTQHTHTHTRTHTQYWYANGDHYIGRWACNKRAGKGRMFLAASSIKLDCSWELDRPAIYPLRLTVESSGKKF